MDKVKVAPRIKIKIGDCVSVPRSFFGRGFAMKLDAVGMIDDKIYGRVVNVVDGNRDFVVKWDMDGDTSSMSLHQITYESVDTQVQCMPSSKSTGVITAEDFEGLAPELEQCSATNAAKTHAILYEDNLIIESTPTHRLFISNGTTKVNVFEAIMIPTSPGAVVHMKKMSDNMAKFQITLVLNEWEGYDEDIHLPGSYVAWDIDHSESLNCMSTEKGQNDDDGNEKDQEDGEKKKKGKKKSQGKGKSFRQSVNRGTEIGVVDEDEGKGKKKKERKRKSSVTKKDVEIDDNGKKKAKLRKTRNLIIVGKKAADKVKEKNKNKSPAIYEDENVLDVEEEESTEEESLDEKKICEKKKEEKKMWTKGNRRVNPREDIYTQAARLTDPNALLWTDESFLEYFQTFLPQDYIKGVMLPATNKKAKENGQTKPFTYEELMHVLGILYMTEIVQLPERRMYWKTEGEGFFPGLCFGKVMSLHRFEEFLNVWQFSNAVEMDQQVLDFIDAVNTHLKQSMKAGEVLCMDESMIKAFHRGLNGKMKIIRKPRPIGNELKTVSDASTNIVLHMELHEPKEDMANKDYVDEYGATTACSLRLTSYWKGTGRIVIGDSWFGSVKTCSELHKINGLYSIMLVKTAHKLYPRFLLREVNLQRGEWTSLIGEVDGLKVMATRFLDLKEKMFISSCSTDLDGPPRKTKYHGLIPRPQVAYDYLKSSASIDIHNHFRTGSTGLEDSWLTKSAHLRQLAGVLGFLFTNSFLAYRHFRKSTMKHSIFKMKLANTLMEYKEPQQRSIRLPLVIPADDSQSQTKVHALVLLEKPKKDKDGEDRDFKRYQKYCFYCQHDPLNPPKKSKTSYECEACVGENGLHYPLCAPSTGRNCFQKHIAYGLPTKRQYKSL